MQGAGDPHLDPKLPGCCTMYNTCITVLSVTNDSCATVTCENFQKRTHRSLISAKLADHGSWIFMSSVKTCDSGKALPNIVQFVGLYTVKVRRFRGTSSSG